MTTLNLSLIIGKCWLVNVSYYRGQERCMQGFVAGGLRERGYLENLGVDG